MKEAHIIFLNDRPEVVVLEDLEKAERIKERLQRKRYERNRDGYKSFAAYCKIYHWHIHTVLTVEK